MPLAAHRACDLSQTGRQGVSGIVSISSRILPQSPLIQTLPWQQKQSLDSTPCFPVLLSPGEHPEAADGFTQRSPSIFLSFSEVNGAFFCFFDVQQKSNVLRQHV